jgi:glycosyltransferase involved in cell wall biosynthesis
MSSCAPESGRPAVWLPAIAAGSGADVYTEMLCDLLNRSGVRARIDWLDRRSEFLPWAFARPPAPAGADLAHVNSCLHRRFIPAGLRWVATVHHVVHDPAFALYKGHWQALYHRVWVLPLERRILRGAARVVAVSDFTSKQVASVFGIRTVDVIPNWVDSRLFHPGGDGRTAPHTPFRLLFVGNPSRRKGADLLPRIAAQLGRGFELRFTGGLRRLQGAGRLPGNMTPIGPIGGREGMAQIYREHDALIFPSRLEGFGLAAAEAQACGLPVVATRGSALPEVVQDGVGGLLCPQDDVGAFAAACRLLAQDHGLWRRLRVDARAWALERLSEAGRAAAYAECYRKALRGPGAG